MPNIDANKPVDIDYKSYQIATDFFYNTRIGDNITEEDVLSSPYIFSDLIYSMCSTICNNVIRIKWALKNIKDNSTIESHPIIDILKNPNHWLDSSSFKEQIILGLLLPSGINKEDTGGQVFIIGTSGKSKNKFVNFRLGEIPDQLFLFWEKRKQYEFKAELDNDNNFLYWKLVYSGTGREERFSYEEVVRINYLNPNCLYKGLSWVYPALELIKQELLTNIYNTSFFANDGRVSGVLSTDNELNNSQRAQIISEWNRIFSGSGNNGKVAVVTDGIKYQQFAPSHTDMQFTELKDRIYERLLSCLKLNKIAMGNYEQVNYATIKEGRRLLDQGTYLPLCNHILSQLNDQWIRYVDKGSLVIESDISGLDTMQPDYTMLSPVFVSFVNAGLPPALAASKIGIPFTEQELADYPSLKEVRQQQQPFSFGGGFTPPGNGPKKKDEDKEDENGDESKKVYRKNFGNIDKKSIVAKFYRDAIDPLEKKFVRELQSYFKWYANMCLNKSHVAAKKELESVETKAEGSKKINVDDYLPNKKISKAKFNNIYKRIIKDTSNSVADYLPKETGNRVEWSVGPEVYSKYLKERYERIDSINSTTMTVFGDRIKAALESAYDENMTVIETAELIQDAIGEAEEIRSNQSLMIARTEMGSVSSEVRMDAYEENDIEYVEWSSADDENVRDSHKAAEDQGPIKLGSKFVNGLRYPNEPGAPAGECIGCRCSILVSEGA